MRLRSRAFTLVEVLLVSSLIAVISLAIFHSFSNGLRLWGRTERLNREAEVAIFLEKMQEDLRSVVVLTGLDFKGIETQTSFGAIVLTQADQKSSRAGEGLIDQIGAVQYRLDVENHRIVRRQANYSQALKGQWGPESVVVEGIDNLVLGYEILSDKGFMMKPEINQGIPRGVMVEVNYTDGAGSHELKRYLSIPIG